MKTPNENPTLGLLICRDKNDTEVQWAFKWINTPLEVATYENIEIKEIREYLPSTEQIQETIAVAEQGFLFDCSRAEWIRRCGQQREGRIVSEISAILE